MTSRNNDRGCDSRCSLRCLLPHPYVCLSFLEENTRGSSAASKDNQMIARLRKVTRIKICARARPCVCEGKHRLIVLPLGFRRTSHLSRHFSSFFSLSIRDSFFSWRFSHTSTFCDTSCSAACSTAKKHFLLFVWIIELVCDDDDDDDDDDDAWGVERIYVCIRTKRSEKEKTWMEAIYLKNNYRSAVAIAVVGWRTKKIPRRFFSFLLTLVLPERDRDNNAHTRHKHSVTHSNYSYTCAVRLLRKMIMKITIRSSISFQLCDLDLITCVALRCVGSPSPFARRWIFSTHWHPFIPIHSDAWRFLSSLERDQQRSVYV